MPPYIRRFRGWDWFTPRAIQHLPWREQERLTQAAWGVVRRDHRHRLVTWLRASMTFLVMGLVGLGQLLKLSLLISLLILLALLVHSMAGVWRRRLFREALRQKLLDAALRPRICFECGYDLEGYQGKECPACDAPLIRQADSPSSMS